MARLSGWQLPLPHPAAILRIHRRALLAVEGLPELVEVLHHAVYPKLAWRVGIHLHHHPRILRTPALAPDLPIRDEELLRRREAIALRSIHVLALRCQCVL